MLRFDAWAADPKADELKERHQAQGIVAANNFVCVLDKSVGAAYDVFTGRVV